MTRVRVGEEQKEDNEEGWAALPEIFCAMEKPLNLPVPVSSHMWDISFSLAYCSVGRIKTLKGLGAEVEGFKKHFGW